MSEIHTPRAAKAQDKKSSSIADPTTIVLIFILTIFAWMLFGAFVYENWREDIDTSAATLGDSFGIVTSFFTALAFAGLILTIVIQRKELEDTREVVEQQNITLRRQRFETTFFNMITIHFKIVEGFKHNEVTGTDVFIKFNNKVSEQMFHKSTLYQDMMTKAQLAQHYRDIYNSHNYIFSAYLRSLIQIMKLIGDSDFPSDVEERYVSIIQSYLSQPEKEFLSWIIVTGNNKSIEGLDIKLQIVNELRDSSSLPSLLIDHVDNIDIDDTIA